MKFSSLKFETTEYPRGIRCIETFPNGYSASIIQNEMSYGHYDGLYEIAVMRDGKLVYDTPITSDVLGWLTEEDVMNTLEKIKNLP